MLEKSIILKFPFLPCSVNEAYKGYPKRVKTDKYRAFDTRVACYMSGEKRYEITGKKWLSVKYVFQFPLFYKNGNIRKRDVANFEKVLSDTLAHNIKGFHDERIKEITMEKVDGEKEMTQVFIYEID